MTREEAKSCIQTIELLRRLAFNVHGVMDVIDVENCDKIIAMLSQEPCEDAVSRQVVLEVLKDKWNAFFDANDAMQESIDTIEALLPVNPQGTGHWIAIDEEPHEDYECDKCGYVCSTFTANIAPYEEYKYCPNCGTKMVEPQESEEV